jgi:hypothetical protein
MNGVGIMMHQASNGSLFLVAMNENFRAPTVIGLSCLQQQQTARTKPGIQVLSSLIFTGPTPEHQDSPQHR